MCPFRASAALWLVAFLGAVIGCGGQATRTGRGTEVGGRSNDAGVTGTGGGGTGGTGGFPACCASDRDCGGDPSVRCVNTICLFPAPDGCWKDSDCAPGEHCQGVKVCPCNADCSYGEEPGKCSAQRCCERDPECGDITAYPPCVNGVCKTELPEGACWTTRQCRTGICLGAVVCGCGEQCEVPDKTGLCGDPR